MITEAVAIIGTLVGSYQDIKDRMIYAFIPYLMACIGFVYHLENGTIVQSIGVGAGFALIAFTLSKKGMWGEADRDFLIALGILLPSYALLFLLAFGLLGACYCSAALMLKRAEAPFIPAMFLTLALVFLAGFV